MMRIEVDQVATLRAHEVIGRTWATARDADGLGKGEERLDGVVVYRIDAVQTKAEVEKDENGKIAPVRGRLVVGPLRVAGGEDLRLGESTVHANNDADASQGVCIDEIPGDQVSSRCRLGDWTDLMAPAAVLGPNHWPISLPSCFPASAIRWMLKGAVGCGVSRNRDSKWT